MVTFLQAQVAELAVIKAAGLVRAEQADVQRRVSSGQWLHLAALRMLATIRRLLKT